MILLLSISLGTLSAFAQQDDRWTYPQQYSMSPKGVNMHTGRFMYQNDDLSIGDLKLTRVWGDTPVFTGTMANTSQFQHIFGSSVLYNRLVNGWSHLLVQGFTYNHNTPSGSVEVFVSGKKYVFSPPTPQGGSAFPQDQGSNGVSFTLSGGIYTLVDRSGARYIFSPQPAFAQTSGFSVSATVQQLQQTTWPDGTVHTYTYDGSANLTEVRSSRGYSIRLLHDGNNNVIQACGYNIALLYVTATSTCAGSNYVVNYSYDAMGLMLVAATDLLSHKVSMSYTAPTGSTNPPVNLPVCISLADLPTCAISNTYAGVPAAGVIASSDPDQIIQQTTATGDFWTYSYEPPPSPADQPVVPYQPRLSGAFLGGPNGQYFNLTYDRGYLIENSSPQGLTRYRYVDRAVPNPPVGSQSFFHSELFTLLTHPAGDYEYFYHDGNQNLIIHSIWPKGAVPTLPDGTSALPSDPDQARCCVAALQETIPTGASTVTQSFPPNCTADGTAAKLCNKPISRIDANSNETDFSYEPAHGGVLTETGPGVNGVRPQTRFGYTQRYAWLAAAAGGYQRAPQPAWLMTSKSVCKTGSASSSGVGCTVANDEAITTYDYGPDSGPNNLLLRGMVEDSTGLALRTCYGYGGQGDRISETKPRAKLAACP